MSAAAPNLNAAWGRALVQELWRCGVRHAVVCPGSRSTPLALALDAEPGLHTHVVIDERSAAFVALGLAKSTGRPACVLATSGTAGGHFLPALLEAEASGVPLLLMTADRPPELQNWGAPQTLDQQHLFGRHVRAFLELGPPAPDEAAFLHLRAEACRAVAAATGPRPGPVHLNLPLREPLAPLPQAVGELSPLALEGRGERPWVQLTSAARAPVPGAIAALAAELLTRPAGVIACGPRDADDGLAGPLAQLAERLGYALIAEPPANLGGKSCLRHADLWLRCKALAERARPQAVLRLGGGLTSKVLQQWIDASQAFTASLSDTGGLFDPSHAGSMVIAGDARQSCAALLEAVSRQAPPRGPLAALLGEAEQRTRAALEAAFAADPRLTEPRVAREVGAALAGAEGAQLVVASSMPIRDLDAFATVAPRTLASRGANGIDGLLSTAVGVRLGSGRPTALLCGDLALLHDLGGLLAARAAGADLTIITIHNDGGGIFSFLPVAQAIPQAAFERYFGTPHGVDLAHAAALAGARYARPTTPDQLAAEIRASLPAGLHLIEVRTDRHANLADHRALQACVVSAVEGVGA